MINEDYNKYSDDQLKSNNLNVLSNKLYQKHKKTTPTTKNEYDLKLPYKHHSKTKKEKCIYLNNLCENQDPNYLENKIYSPPEENLNELCEMFDIISCSGDNNRSIEFVEIKRLRTLCVILEQSNNDLDYVTKRLDHENKCYEPRIKQLKEINKTLLGDNAEYIGRSVENKFLLKDVEKLKELLDALTNAVNEEVNNHCHLQEEYFAAEFNRKQFEKDRMIYELSSIATNHQLNNLSMKKAYLESLKEDLIKKQVYVNRLQDIKGLFRVIVKIQNVHKNENDSIFSFFTDDKVGIKILRPSNKYESEIKIYQFNKVLKPDCSINDLSNALGRSIDQIINGYNVCLIHFGTSGSGKSQTVIGNFLNEFGISSLFIGKFIDEMNREHRKLFKIEVSFLEFYNDSVLCLLSGKKVKFQDTGKKIKINDYVREYIVDLNKYNRLLHHASQRRQTSATSYCSQSSRSHLVIVISIKSKNNITFCKTTSRMLICDLAGFEKSSCGFQKVRKQHMDETYHINNSLSSLSQIIEEFHLYKLKTQYLSHRNSALPFRSSKLTQFLKPCFCGDAYCYLILHISDDFKQVHSTYKTLQLGQIAMSTELGKPICHKLEPSSSCITKYIV